MKLVSTILHSINLGHHPVWKTHFTMHPGNHMHVGVHVYMCKIKVHKTILPLMCIKHCYFLSYWTEFHV